MLHARCFPLLLSHGHPLHCPQAGSQVQVGEDFSALLLACRHDLSPSWLSPGSGSCCPWMAGEDRNLLDICWQFAFLNYAWVEKNRNKVQGTGNHCGVFNLKGEIEPLFVGCL